MECMLKGLRVHTEHVHVRIRPSTDVDALKIEHGSILSASTDVDALGVNAQAFSTCSVSA